MTPPQERTLKNRKSFVTGNYAFLKNISGPLGDLAMEQQNQPSITQLNQDILVLQESMTKQEWSTFIDPLTHALGQLREPFKFN